MAIFLRFQYNTYITDFINFRITWTKNGKPFVFEKESDRIKEEIKDNRHSIIFNLAKSSDTGIYQCFGRNAHGFSESHKILVREIQENNADMKQPEVRY